MMNKELLYYIVVYGVPCVAAVALAWLSVRCRPSYGFRSSYQHPIFPAQEDIDRFLDDHPEFSPSQRSTVCSLASELRENRENYDAWEKTYNDQTAQQELKYLVLCPLLCLLAVHWTCGGILWPALAAGAVVFLLACSFYRRRGVMTYVEKDSPDHPLVPFSYKSLDDFLTFWNREKSRSFSAVVDRSRRIDEMLKSCSNYRQVFTLLSVGAVIGVIVNFRR